eukprot:Hpha_TRINITY_DN15361_c1_g1::TRINITY_DN15361_c1_g1_i1::g.87998::m.87998
MLGLRGGAMRLFAAALLSLGSVAVAASTVRLAITPPYTLQPLDKHATACPNVSSTDCFGGWARLNAFVRMTRKGAVNRGMPYFLVMSPDIASQLVNFHPTGFSLNHGFYGRSGGDAYAIENWVVGGNIHEYRFYDFVRNAPALPVQSNSFQKVVSFSSAIQRFSAMNKSGVTVLFLTVEIARSPEQLDIELALEHSAPPLRERYNADVVVVKITDSLSSTSYWAEKWADILSAYADVVVGRAPESENTTLQVLRNSVTGRAVSVVKIRSAYDSLLTVDYDTVSRTVVAVDDHFFGNPLPRSLRNAEYEADTALLQRAVGEAAVSDPIIGNSALPFPDWSNCTFEDCPLGNWWCLVSRMQNPEEFDFAFHN